MTAARPSSERPPRVRALALAVCVAVAWTPWALVWGDAFADAAAAGRQAGRSLRGTLALPAISGGALSLVPGSAAGTVPVGELFPGAGAGSGADFAALYGSDAGTRALGRQAQEGLPSEPSATGAAYRTLRATLDRARPDLRADGPLWSGTDGALDGIEGLGRTFKDCTTSTVFRSGQRLAPVSDLRTCDRLAERPSATCTARRRATLEAGQVRDAWTWDAPDCPGTVALLGNGFCVGAARCTRNPGSDCLTLGDETFCGERLQPPPVAAPGIGRGCLEIAATVDCRAFNRGPMDCWTDAQGRRQCPFNAGDRNDDCAALERDPRCRRVASVCVPGASDAGSRCFLHEETWDCGQARSVPVLSRVRSVDCAGPVRCMGTDCADFPEERSGDFARVAATLQAAQMAVSDMQCRPGGACLVFAGEARSCKRAVGGIVDCCKVPQGVSLADYLDLVFSLGKLDSALLGLDKGSAIRGAWETLRQPVASTWSAVSESFASVANNLMGKTAASATDAAARLSLDAFKQQLLARTAEWAARTFGDAAVNVLFSTAEGGAAVSGGAVQGQLRLGGGSAWLGTAMAWAMYAYLVYTVAMILIRLIWTCERSEFELGAKRALKACHAVGGYCRKKVLGWCVEKRDAYCCFNTPLARILNEQIRPQLGRGWGSPKSPDCSGIEAGDLTRVDWERVNLDEWLAILVETGHFPTADTLGIDALTGAGSVFATGEGRANAAARTVRRAAGLDAERIRADAQRELWNETLPALPDAANAKR